MLIFENQQEEWMIEIGESFWLRKGEMIVIVN